MKHRKRSAYIGSVRFYKHLILTVTALLILVPTVLSVYLGICVKKLSDENLDLLDEEILLEREYERQLEASLSSQDLSVQEVKIPYTTGGETSIDEWNLILVSEASPLQEEYEVELTAITGGQKVDSRIVEPLIDMMSQMRKEGMRPMVCSGYRTIEKQSDLFHEYIDEKVADGWDYGAAFYKAKSRIALPGTSEHHTGLAVDIVGVSHQELDDKQAETLEAKWLAEHCAEYGFILRYPEGKTKITGIDYESWHFRYVGEEAASYIMEHGLTLEEYLEMIE